jgi:manganese/zinc/iron transport system ATP- binding protein
MDYALEMQGVHVQYGMVPVLWDINLAITPGQLIGIIGPNGAGKSSLLQVALGLIKPMSGLIRFLGQPLLSVRKAIAYVPQKETIDWTFPITALEVVLMGRYRSMRWWKIPNKQDKKAAYTILERVGMQNFAHRQIADLSGGQQQRLFLARALMQQADLYFLDEPFQYIDVTTEKIMIDILRLLKQEGKTIFIVHHNPSTLREYFDSLILLNTSLIAVGKTQLVLTKENLQKTYQQTHALFDEMNVLASQKHRGLC